MTTNEADFQNYFKSMGLEKVGEFDIPKIRGIKFKDLNSVDLIGFNYATNKRTEDKGNKIVHFFLPDGAFECVWRTPEKYAEIFGQYRAVAQPDFSQYIGMPKAMLVWQHYRRQMLAAWFQSQGLKVIPTPCWSDESSFEYCFDGLPKGSCVLVSTVGCVKKPRYRRAFLKGFDEMIRRLKPSQLIIYGKTFDELFDHFNCEYIVIPSDQRKRIDAWKERVKAESENF